jgi:hypothetical protein
MKPALVLKEPSFIELGQLWALPCQNLLPPLTPLPHLIAARSAHNRSLRLQQWAYVLIVAVI